jgi:hypothetical protein
MSESKTTCPICKRPPGGIHKLDCPNGRVAQRELARDCVMRHTRRWFHLAKGIAQRESGGIFKPARWVENPGIGYSLKPLAAGWPRSITRAEALAIVKSFSE